MSFAFILSQDRIHYSQGKKTLTIEIVDIGLSNLFCHISGYTVMFTPPISKASKSKQPEIAPLSYLVSIDISIFNWQKAMIENWDCNRISPPDWI